MHNKDTKKVHLRIHFVLIVTFFFHVHWWCTIDSKSQQKYSLQHTQQMSDFENNATH